MELGGLGIGNLRLHNKAWRWNNCGGSSCSMILCGIKLWGAGMAHAFSSGLQMEGVWPLHEFFKHLYHLLSKKSHFVPFLLPFFNRFHDREVLNIASLLSRSSLANLSFVCYWSLHIPNCLDFLLYLEG